MLQTVEIENVVSSKNAIVSVVVRTQGKQATSAHAAQRPARDTAAFWRVGLWRLKQVDCDV